jgi:hypothetical protein
MGIGPRESVGDSFEQLWLLRTSYVWRSEYDSHSTLSVAGAVEYGEQLMRLARIRERWRRYGTINRAA